MEVQLKNKVALITGAASGIGRSLAKTYSDSGASVGIIDINEEGGIATKNEILEDGGEAIFLKADVSSKSDVKAAVDAVVKEYGRIDILVNNAALATRGTVASLSVTEWNKHINVNLNGIYLCSHFVLPIMIEQESGVILNIGSVASLVGVEGFAAYVTSKTGILGITRAMALDHSSQGIRVNCVCPSGIKTPLMDWQFQTSSNPEIEKKRVIEMHPSGRMADPEELASFLVYLASDQADYITGAIYTFDGGYTAK